MMMYGMSIMTVGLMLCQATHIGLTLMIHGITITGGIVPVGILRGDGMILGGGPIIGAGIIRCIGGGIVHAMVAGLTMVVIITIMLVGIMATDVIVSDILPMIMVFASGVRESVLPIHGYLRAVAITAL